MAPAAPEPHHVPVPALDGVDQFITHRFCSVGLRWFIVHTGHFTSDMNAKGIQNIIRTLARRGHDSVVEHGMIGGSNSGIIFDAEFTEWEHGHRDVWNYPEAVATAKQVLAEGWEALNMLPKLWPVWSVWDLVTDTTIHKPVRDAYLEEALYVTRIACEGRIGLVMPSDYCTSPEIGLATTCFRSLYHHEFELWHPKPGFSTSRK